jgi:hypothetical protein
MDSLAKAYWIHCAPEGPSSNLALTDELWTLRLNGLKVSSDARIRIYDHIHGEQGVKGMNDDGLCMVHKLGCM